MNLTKVSFTEIICRPAVKSRPQAERPMTKAKAASRAARFGTALACASFFALLSCAHTAADKSRSESSAEQPAPRAPAALAPQAAEPASSKAQRGLAFFSPSVLPFAKNRDMARFYSRWASQFQEAVKHYRAAAKQYKKAAKHFEKMSEYTKRRKDQQFRKHFEEAAARLKEADGFLAKAQSLRNKKNPSPAPLP